MNTEVVAGHRHSPVKEYYPRFVPAGKFIVSHWLFVISDAKTLALCCLRGNADNLSLTQTCSVWSGFSCDVMSGARRL
jgi:hypothetical protein